MKIHEYQAKELFRKYNIPVPEGGVAFDVEAAEKVAGDLGGFPVVVKADAGSIVHKSDIGGVAVDLRDGDAVRAAAEGMAGRFGTEGLQFFVQEYCPGGLEVIVGAKAEKGLGHLVMFGVGGIYVEVLKDVVFKLTPVTTVEAGEMLSSIRAAPLLEGVRGSAGVDREGLIGVIERLSQLVTEQPAIREMDLNPIIAYADRVCVVDARVSL